MIGHRVVSKEEFPYKAGDKIIRSYETAGHATHHKITAVGNYYFLTINEHGYESRRIKSNKWKKVKEQTNERH